MGDETLIESVEQLDEAQSRPPEALVSFMRGLDGDIVVIGAGGKMGLSLARMAKRAGDASAVPRRVIAVSRFTDRKAREALHEAGVETLACDLLEESAVDALPGVENVVFMAGWKFGSAGDPARLWATNVYLPARVMRRYRGSRVVVFSTGNVYPFVPPETGGCTEEQPAAPVGEYAQSCLGRERVAAWCSGRDSTPTAIIRLNYAIDLRYGVLLDIGLKVYRGEPVDLRMGWVNVIWQADANAAALLALGAASVPPFVLNVTGPEILSVRRIAESFGNEFSRAPVFAHEEECTALLSHAGRFRKLFPIPLTSTRRMIRLVAHWIQIGGPTWGKPTGFERRDGVF
ncbi:MAG: NAD(P)-dependent oxidoreductase [Bacteroidota bacterium]|nr:NAD(P)-dependent oxidoreductase [Bacteroidota bacterium]